MVEYKWDDRTQSMARFWTQSAPNYDSIVQNELHSFRVDAWQKLFMEKLPKCTKKILDMGCGPGFFSIILGKMGYDVTGIDISGEMLHRAKNAAEKEGVRVSFQRMSCTQMDFEANSFDAIVSRNVTWTLHSPDSVYTTCQRILQSWGRLLIFDANWHHSLFDVDLSTRERRRREECIKRFGSDFESTTPITEPIDIAELPLSHVQRPQWDVDVLKRVGFSAVECDLNLVESLWDEKERLLYGETPLFGVYASV